MSTIPAQSTRRFQTIDAPDARKVPAADQFGADGAVLRVVIADDSDRYRDGIVRALHRRGGVAVVGQARDGDEALALARDLVPDVLVVDDRMPIAGGFAVARMVADDWSLRTVRIVMLSGSVSPELTMASVAAGAFARIDKAASRMEICAAIRHAGHRDARGTTR